MEPADYPLMRSQTAAMAAIRRYVADGYLHYLVTTTPSDKVLQAVQALQEKHRVLISPEAQRVRREAGLPTARLVLGPEPQGGRWPYALLATAKLPNERMTRAKQTPLRWLAWREQAWRPTYVLRPDPDTARWTWFLEEAFYKELLEEALLHTSRGDWPRLVGHLKTLGNLPRFGGIHGQLEKIRKRTQQAWGDRHLRSPDGQWRQPPWRKALEDWPRRPLGANVYLYVRPEEDRPRTLGEWLKRGGT
ncbi:hypothetical protein [Meiothermus cerbereus]|uniref:hypothetical protein n=1 Tax=Meiothermus cerbereus TaxID=65552 RepID=UPI0005642F55|nr:hypothetical protein [Meiothermus cerbereus]